MSIYEYNTPGLVQGGYKKNYYVFKLFYYTLGLFGMFHLEPIDCLINYVHSCIGVAGVEGDGVSSRRRRDCFWAEKQKWFERENSHTTMAVPGLNPSGRTPS